MPDRAELDRAIRLYHEGNLAAATSIVEAVVRAGDATCGTQWYLGQLYWAQGLLEQAIDMFRRATRSNPKSERASIGLFHTLFEAGEVDEAFDEMRRFMATGDSEEYRRLLLDINEA